MHTTSKKLFLFTIVLFAVASLNAQTYTFSQTTATYQDIETPDYEIPETSPGFGNIALNLDFHFPAFGTVYDFNERAKIVTLQGHWFHVNATRSFTNYFFEVDLAARADANETSVWSYQLTGEKGNQLLKMEWKNMGFENGGDDDFINYQVWLYEGTGKIEIRIGPHSVSSEVYADKPGPAIGVLEMTPNFSSIYEEMYLVGSASSPEVTTDGYNFLTGTPDEGTVYVFENSLSSIEPSPNTRIDFNIYPSHTPSSITVSLDDASELDNATIEIVNLNGQVLQSMRLVSSVQMVNVAHLKQGAYLIRISSESTVLTKVFIKS